MVTQPAPKAERTVRTGIIGCGKIAPNHAAALAALPESQFVATCDGLDGRAKEMAEKHGAPLHFLDYHEMLRSGEVEAVCVCTPHPAHAEIVVAAAEAGVHVICEKPIAIKLAEADQMIAASRKAGTRFGVIFQRRFWPASQRIRAAIDRGALGNTTLAECQAKLWRSRDYFGSDPWRGTWAAEGGGVLMNQAVHFIDKLQWFMGPAVEVIGRMATLRHGEYIDVEDTVAATVVFANGGLATINAATTYDPPFGFRVQIHGDSGATVSVNEQPEGAQGINDIWSIPGEESLREQWAAEESKGKGFPSFHALQIQEFLQSILADRDPAVTGEEARKSLEIILAIYHSSRTDQPVKLPLATDPD